MTTWTRSSACDFGDCVEARRDGDTITVRDSKDPDGTGLTFTVEEWMAFLQGVRAGEFNPVIQS